jgi:hypothetical protein
MENSKFLIAKSRRELKPDEVEKGVTFMGEHQEIVEKFKNIETCEKAFEKYATDIIGPYSTVVGQRVSITEYHIIDTGDNGELMDGLATTPLPAEWLEKVREEAEEND